MASRPRYTGEELEEYFDRICLPSAKRMYNVRTLPDDQKLEYLNLLQKHQLIKVPWENLVQHYSWHTVVNVKPKHLFKKIVRQPGRGGYCMEVNSFFHTVLLSLGFDVYMTGARIYSAPKKTFGGWTHVVNLVTVGSTKYLLDGGFGGPGPSRPIPLEHGKIRTQVPPAQMRLVYKTLAQNLTGQKVWVYESRFEDDALWTPCYSFSEMEFTPEDIESMNFAPWTSRHSFFTHKIVAVRFSTDRERNGPGGPGSPSEAALEGEVDGAITINQNVLKWRRNGKKICDWHFQNEDDRLMALEMYFGIVLADEDKEAIAGTAAAMGHGRAMDEHD
jgi:arylamine N-acetyltransferase